MSDEIDRAALISEAHTERCVGAVTRQLRQTGTLDCEICGEEIPERRRQAMPSAVRCAPCQEAMEIRCRAR